jgi:DNA replication protein DnaC
METRNEIAACCKRLRLSQNLATNIDGIESEDREQFLLTLLRKEIEHRDEARKARNLKQAGFYTLKSFDDYRFDDITLPTGLTPEGLRQCGFVSEKKNLILYGNVGTGKTHLATAIGVEACKQGLLVKFFRTASLVNQLLQAKKGGELPKFLKQLSKQDLLICDEWGYVPVDRDGARLLFQVVSDCYETRSIVLTTNLEFSRWVTIFYDEQMTTAMIDRLVHHSHLLVFDGESWRMRNSLIRQ